MAISTLKATDNKTQHMGIDKKSRAQVAEKISQALASTYALTLKTQFYHWNVTGPHFIALHKLFEGQYNALAAANDELAERIRALGHFTPGTFQEFSKATLIKEDKALPASWEEMIENLIKAHETMSRFYREAVPYAQDLKDEGTADMFIGRSKEHEKTAWMLRAHLE